MSESVEQLLWKTVQTTAQRLLEDVERICVMPEAALRLVHLRHQPLFGPVTSWTVFTPSPQRQSGIPPENGEDQRRSLVRDAPVAVALGWDRPRDYEAIFQPKVASALPGPTIHMRDAFIPQGELQKILMRAPSIAMADITEVSPSEPEIESWLARMHGPHGATVELRWEDAGPPAWRPVTEWVTRLRALLAYCFDPWIHDDAIDRVALRARGAVLRGDERFSISKCVTCGAIHLADDEGNVIFPDHADLSRTVPEHEYQCPHPEGALSAAETPEGQERPGSATWRDVLPTSLRWIVRADAVPSYFSPSSADVARD